jgi:hypothetical protein
MLTTSSSLLAGVSGRINNNKNQNIKTSLIQIFYMPQMETTVFAETIAKTQQIARHRSRMMWLP